MEPQSNNTIKHIYDMRIPICASIFPFQGTDFQFICYFFSISQTPKENVK